MAKWCGLIGYAEMVETSPGKYNERIVTHKHYGDVLKNTRRLQTADSINDNIEISNEISIVADAYAKLNIHHMRYIEFMGAKWKISNVNVEYPRLKLTIGGLYNG